MATYFPVAMTGELQIALVGMVSGGHLGDQITEHIDSSLFVLSRA